MCVFLDYWANNKKIVDYKTAQQKPKVTKYILVSPTIDLNKETYICSAIDLDFQI